MQICIVLTDGKNKSIKEDKSKPQNHNLVFSNKLVIVNRSYTETICELIAHPRVHSNTSFYCAHSQSGHAYNYSEKDGNTTINYTSGVPCCSVSVEISQY